MSDGDQRVAYARALAAERNRNEAALHILPTLTRDELTRLITKRPEVWARFSSWLERLP